MQISASNISFSYGNNLVFEDLSLEVKHGEIITIIGPNGCGKSTLLKNMARILKPDAGAVYINKQTLDAFKNNELARCLSVLPQSNIAPGSITVEDLVSYGRFPYQRFLQGMSTKDYEIVEKSLSLTDLISLRHRAVASLSGGERQRAWLALNLAQEPKIMLLDEPTTYLDICHQFEVIDLIKKMNKQLGVTIIMVLHDLNLAARCSDRIIAIKDKKIFKKGTVSEIINEKVLQKVFHIKAHVINHDGTPYFIPLGTCKNSQGENKNE